MRSVISFAEHPDIAGKHYHLGIVNMPCKQPGRVAKLKGKVLTAAKKAGFVVLIVGDKSKTRAKNKVPRALESLNKLINYKDRSGKIIKLPVTQNDLLVKEGKKSRVFLDAQARPLYISTMKRFVRRQNQITDEELIELWRKPIELCKSKDIIDCRINNGGFQNVAHLHLKIKIKPTIFEKNNSSNPAYIKIVNANKIRKSK